MRTYNWGSKSHAMDILMRAYKDSKIFDFIWPLAHNSYSGDPNFLADQVLSIPQLLDQGVRVLELDVHKRLWSDDVLVSHWGEKDVIFGKKLYIYLKQINNWLQNNSKAFVIIKFESFIPLEDLLNELNNDRNKTFMERVLNREGDGTPEGECLSMADLFKETGRERHAQLMLCFSGQSQTPDDHFGWNDNRMYKDMRRTGFIFEKDEDDKVEMKAVRADLHILKSNIGNLKDQGIIDLSDIWVNDERIEFIVEYLTDRAENEGILTGRDLKNRLEYTCDESKPYQMDYFDYLKSEDGKYKLILQADGNLVLYDDENTARWAPNYQRTFQGKKYEKKQYYRKEITSAIMQEDGNFVMYGKNRVVEFTTNTGGNRGAYLILQNDGNLVVYSKDKKTPLWAIWSSKS